jgi:hypothetical protein
VRLGIVRVIVGCGDVGGCLVGNNIFDQPVEEVGSVFDGWVGVGGELSGKLVDQPWTTKDQRTLD